ncbi:LAQU0S20e00936g1_1 [Lachancea quebecensis]|uniref:LAQU0S20e00936g1_1 n=1 Tax=Lachancea quebecensis TaxID=1654605 RepID=A0A0P1KXR7_9SACH|nr:LAQU0S20e00936g1_1 [Lachancea quebecensis]
MGVLSSVNVTFFRVAFLSFLAFACLRDVNMVLNNPSVLLFTHSMRLPALILPSHSAQLGLVSMLFGLLATHDFIPLLERNKMFFESIVPIRLMFFFILTALSYYMEENLYIHNNAVFIYGFCEVWMNFLIFSALRDERNEEFKRSNRILAEDQMLPEEDDEQSGSELEEMGDTSAEE